ncbi:hypothetical protein LTR37_018174 [Vermiconidia calcicola]|uniref:Uncharacterized protein n=1 Tax=Vermiconidia calcicola TaxID=1690605 RepID=A0ACC3MHT5_9PEZI|nr:hypothetical protein LTR37_018174 [Vermiconidia calcicola]
MSQAEFDGKSLNRRRVLSQVGRIEETTAGVKAMVDCEECTIEDDATYLVYSDAARTQYLSGLSCSFQTSVTAVVRGAPTPTPPANPAAAATAPAPVLAASPDASPNLFMADDNASQNGADEIAHDAATAKTLELDEKIAELQRIVAQLEQERNDLAKRAERADVSKKSDSKRIYDAPTVVSNQKGKYSINDAPTGIGRSIRDRYQQSKEQKYKRLLQAFHDPEETHIRKRRR